MTEGSSLSTLMGLIWLLLYRYPLGHSSDIQGEKQ